MIGDTTILIEDDDEDTSTHEETTATPPQPNSTPITDSEQVQQFNQCLADARELLNKLKEANDKARQAKNKWGHAFFSQCLPNINLGVLAGYWPSGIKAMNDFLAKYTYNLTSLVLAPVNALIGYFIIGNLHNCCSKTTSATEEITITESNTHEEVMEYLMKIKYSLEEQRELLKTQLAQSRESKTRTAAEIAVWAVVGLIQSFTPEAAAVLIAPMGPVALPIAVALATAGIAKTVEQYQGKIDIDAVIEGVNSQIDTFAEQYGLQAHTTVPSL